MALTAGERLGPYEIVERIGAGGMGEVYRARDPRLNREVAIKVSQEKFSERFEREAKAVAALNHPNICQVYDVGSNYLVMELVEGPTLAELIKQGPIPIQEALALARQMAEALDAAHEKGIVHRDFKPGNVKIKPDGTVKVLDFGLAKTGGAPMAASSDSPTLTIAQTEAGVILGTASYMAPEQAKGKPVDKRADIYAFGAVLYEMLTGKRLHQGGCTTEVLASVMKEEPGWDAVPPQVRRLLQRCLEKDPQKRLRHIGDVMALVDEGPVTALPSRSLGRRLGGLPWGIATASVAALAALALVHFHEAKPPVLTATFQIPPDKLNFNIGTNANVSPDGRWLAFPAVGPDNVSRMWVRALDSLEVKPLEAAETTGALTPAPFWSPDSRFIAYIANGKLKKQVISGGPPEVLADSIAVVAAGGTWNRDGIIVWGNNSGALERTSASGGRSTPVTVFAPGDTAHRFPQFLPDGHHFIYQRTGKPETTGMYVGSIDVKPEAQSLKPLFISDRQAEYAPSRDGGPGWMLFSREGALMAQHFNPDKLQLSGDPIQVASDVSAFATVNIALYSVSENDELVYRSGSSGQLQLTWADAQGKATGTLGDPGQYRWPELSPDGARVAVALASQQGNIDIWVLDVAHGGTSRRLTFDPAIELNPVWSPDGKQIVFASDRNGHVDLYMHAADGSGEDQLLLKSEENKVPTGFSRDGRFLLYTSTNPKTRGDIWVLPMVPERPGGERKPFPFLRTEFNESFAQFSPDGHWIAYMSNESGVAEIYVRPFVPGAEAPGGKSMLSKGGGMLPRWRGNQLIYSQLDGRVWAVDVTIGKTLEYKVPKLLFQAPSPASSQTGGGAISADGSRFLFVAPQGASNAPAPFTVVLNWQAGLKK